MTKRKPPRWVVPFLRALERTGKVRQAAEDAGVDHTTAYARRRTHAEFAEAWAEAKKRHAAAEKEQAEVPWAPDPSTIRSAADGSPPHPAGREELVISGNRLKRASGERWGPRKQEAFLAELATTGVLRRACDAVRISRQAIDRRRRNDPCFDAACHAPIAECRRRLPEFLAGAAAATFDPDALPDDGPNPLPRMSIDQALKMAQLWGLTSTPHQPAVEPYDAGEVARRLEAKLDAIRQESLADGWSYDERHDCMVPPGWSRMTGETDD